MASSFKISDKSKMAERVKKKKADSYGKRGEE
jgi:hypothetical protein